MGVVVNKRDPNIHSSDEIIIIMMKAEPVTLFIICDGLRSLHVSNKERSNSMHRIVASVQHSMDFQHLCPTQGS